MKHKLGILLLALCLVSGNSEAVMYQNGNGKDYTTDANFQWGYTMNVDESPIQDLGVNDYDLSLKGAGEPDFLAVEDNTGGYLFDGTDDYCNKDIADTKIEAYPFTLYARIRWDGDADTDTVVAVVDKDATNIMYGITVVSTGAPAIFARNTDLYETNHNLVMTAGQWYSVVAVFTSATVRNIYLNGVVGTTTGTDSVTFNTATDRIGVGMKLDSSPSETFNGPIGELAGFNKAFTQAEITEISAKGLRGHRL